MTRRGFTPTPSPATLLFSFGFAKTQEEVVVGQLLEIRVGVSRYSSGSCVAVFSLAFFPHVRPVDSLQWPFERVYAVILSSFYMFDNANANKDSMYISMTLPLLEDIFRKRK